MKVGGLREVPRLRDALRRSRHETPRWLHQAIQDMELNRTAYSKYYLVVLALRPSLLEDCDVRFAEGSDD